MFGRRLWGSHEVRRLVGDVVREEKGWITSKDAAVREERRTWEAICST